MFDREMRYLQVSRRWREDYGLGDRDLAGVSHYDVFPGIPERWKEAHRRGLTGEVVSADNDRFDLADGSVQWLRWEVRPWYEAEGRVGGIVIFAEDVTARKRAEEALRENHARLRKVLEVETVGVLFWDLTTGRLVDANDTFLNLMGYSRSDVQAGELTWQKLTPPEYLEMSRAELRKFAASGRVGPYEKEYFHKDGTRQWFVFAGSSLGGNSCVEFCVDISERKKAEVDLRDSERRVRSLMESTAEAIVGDDLEGNCTFCNPAALRLLGYKDQAELLGKKLHVTMHHSQADGTPFSTDNCPIGQAVRAGYEFHSDDLVLWRKDGTCFPAECWSHPVCNQGKTIGAVLTFFDISERKHAEEEIREGRTRLEAALASMTDAVFISDLEGRFVDFNDAFATFHKFSRKADCAKTLAEYPAFLDVFMENGQAAPLEMWAVPRALRGETVTNAEYSLRRKDTDESWVGSYSFAPIRGEGGEIVGSVVVARDITQKKANEQEILRLNEDLEQRVEQRTAQLQAANKELEAFTYSVSHDLRAPLRHIVGFSRMLAEEFGQTLPPEARHYVQRISDGTRRMGVLVDDLLNLGRVGRQELQLQVTGLRSIVDEVVSDLSPECANRQVEWKISALPFVDCDPRLLKQVLQNLLSNALKFTRPRNPAVIEVGQKDENGASMIYVRDNGVGFSMKYSDKLFGVFQRLHRQEDFEGTGVGLATVQRIIQKHGGRIWAEAELDKGATFYFTLAVGEKDSAAAKSVSAGGNT
jgi:PAS domain S-box-containing protein